MSYLMRDDTEDSVRTYQVALAALRDLPDRCAPTVGELADRIGADKLDLLHWVRSDITFARLIASKVTA